MTPWVFYAKSKMYSLLLLIAKRAENILTMLRRGKTIGWLGLIKVDGEHFQWMGGLSGIRNVNQTAFEYTSTKSIFTMNVDNRVLMKITFLSPITPKDLKRMSLVYSYLEVEVESADGQPHNVQLYSDISAGKFPVINGCIN
jgi:hypothetical protein